MSMEVSMLLDAFALRLRAEDCEGQRLVLNLELTDIGERHVVWVENSVLHHRGDTAFDDADATLRLTKVELLMAAAGLGVSSSIEVDGDAGALERLAGWMDRFDANFAIVTP
jgi:alkyl sulfatase BDS1-like metallo-beta-lactamase superfamily hydrolase